MKNLWDKPALLQSPLFRPLHPAIARLGGESFPSLQDCNELLTSSPIVVRNGLPLRFVAQEYGKLSFEAQYEPRCYLKGEVQTRADNWHDLLNALVWLAFPKAKAAINARHYDAQTDAAQSAGDSSGGASSSQRGAVRDMNTLFDESGVVVPCADPELAGLLRDFRWKELFWSRRERVSESMDFFLFGHGLYEKALQPYVGMTGQGLLLPVEPAFFGWPLERQLAHLDELLAQYLIAPEHCRSTAELTPVPLLGVPDWTPDNDSPAYYDNTAYFRPGRRRQSA
ncbi:MAG: DUF3025 domain-containing protein [Gallionella sp.]|jgi:hypothetical protein|nr:DUF3025 domain-containing protein [Gallionella sp.]MCK9355511.1 DUF3025 domain-containing protein [Gallionella sp.]